MRFERIQKAYLFSWKLTFKKRVLFSNVEGLYTQMLTGVNPSECGTVVTHRTTDIRVLNGRSSNLTYHKLTFLLAD